MGVGVDCGCMFGCKSVVACVGLGCGCRRGIV